MVTCRELLAVDKTPRPVHHVVIMLHKYTIVDAAKPVLMPSLFWTFKMSPK